MTEKKRRPSRRRPGAAQLAEFCRYLQEEEKSPATIQKYRHDILCFLDYSGPASQWTKDQVIDFKAALERRYAIRSANSMLTAVNQFLKYLGHEECCVKQFRLQPNTFCDQRKELSKDDYFRLLDAALETGRVQMYFLLQTICATGIRVSELRYITVEALQSGTAVAHNKGKSRVILIPRRLCEVLLGYAAQCAISSGPVFLTSQGNVLDRSNIWSAMKALSLVADVAPEKVYPHNLRHLFARTFYQQERDISRLADILGHRSVNTTRGYIISSGEEHRAQIETLGLFVSTPPMCGEKETAPHNVRLCGVLPRPDRKRRLLAIWSSTYFRKKNDFSRKYVPLSSKKLPSHSGFAQKLRIIPFCPEYSKFTIKARTF